MPNVSTIRVVIPENKVVKINVNRVAGGGGGGFTPGIQPTHWFLAGPVAGAPALAVFRPIDRTDVAFAPALSEANQFTNVNKTPGLRIGSRTVTADYSLTSTDFEVLVDAASGPVTITLPAATQSGQFYRIKKIDASANAVTVEAQSGDMIDGSSSVTITNQYDDCTLINADTSFWDKFTGLGGGFNPLDLARLSVPNLFADLNSFKGVTFNTRTVTADYTATPLDFEICVDASSGNATISLPVSSGSGQMFHLKRIDASGNTVTIQAAGSDTIDGDNSVPLSPQWAGLFVLDAASGYWSELSTVIDLSGTAQLTLPNVFTEVNTLPGIRHTTRTVTDATILTSIDYEVLVDAQSVPVTISLPPALGTGQVFRVKKIDNSENPVTVDPDGTDLIDGASSVLILGQYDGFTFIDASVGEWDKAGVVLTGLAQLATPNVFTELNSFSGLRFATTKTVTDDYVAQPTDLEILVDATANDITVTLPPALGTGQIFRIKKIDSSSNLVTVEAQSGDEIDGSISLTFSTQYSDCQLIDAAVGYWDNTGGGSTGGGGADFGLNGRVRDLYPVRGFAFDVFNGTSWVEQVRYVEPSAGPPVSAPVGYYWRPDVTNLTQLKAFPTVGNDLGTRIDCLFSDGLRSYIWESGAADVGDPGQVAPDDYDGTTNDVHLRQIL